MDSMDMMGTATDNGDNFAKQEPAEQNNDLESLENGGKVRYGSVILRPRLKSYKQNAPALSGFVTAPEHLDLDKSYQFKLYTLKNEDGSPKLSKKGSKSFVGNLSELSPGDGLVSQSVQILDDKLIKADLHGSLKFPPDAKPGQQFSLQARYASDSKYACGTQTLDGQKFLKLVVSENNYVKKN